MHRLPRRTNSQVIGSAAQDALSATFGWMANVVPVPGGKDFGIDFHCELFTPDGFPTGCLFDIQCKGTNESRQTRHGFSIQLRTATVSHWLIRCAPVFLVVVDLSFRRFYWCYPRAVVDKRDDWQKNASISIPVPAENVFTFDVRQLPDAMMDIINRSSRDILRAFSLRQGHDDPDPPDEATSTTNRSARNAQRIEDDPRYQVYEKSVLDWLRRKTGNGRKKVYLPGTLGVVRRDWGWDFERPYGLVGYAMLDLWGDGLIDWTNEVDERRMLVRLTRKGRAVVQPSDAGDDHRSEY